MTRTVAFFQMKINQNRLNGCGKRVMEAEGWASALAKASAYLVGSREDGHEATQHGGADAGDVDERPLTVTDRYRGGNVI